MASPHSAIQGLNPVSGCGWEEGSLQPEWATYIPDLWGRMSLCHRRPLTQLPSSHLGAEFGHAPHVGTHSVSPSLFGTLFHSVHIQVLSHTKSSLNLLFFLSLNPETTLELLNITGGLGDDWGEGTYYQQALHNPCRTLCSMWRTRLCPPVAGDLWLTSAPGQEAT